VENFSQHLHGFIGIKIGILTHDGSCFQGILVRVEQDFIEIEDTVELVRNTRGGLNPVITKPVYHHCHFALQHIMAFGSDTN